MKRLKVPGRPYQAPSVDELYHSETRTTRSPCELLDPRLVGEGRERELSTLCGQSTVRDPENGTAALHQNSSRQVR